MPELICAILCGALSIGALVIAIRSFKEKGFLFNNAYIWASKQERAKMDKKPHYRQSAIVFTMIAALFLCVAMDALLALTWLWIVEAAICASVVVYAIISSIK